MARALRRRLTDAERKLWYRLRDRRLDGLKFKRQALIGRFVVDFACLEHHLIVELDGSQHGRHYAIAHDRERTRLLEAMGYLVLRFWNDEVLKNMDGVLTTILAELHRLGPEGEAALPVGSGASSPRPSPLRGEGGDSSGAERSADGS